MQMVSEVMTREVMFVSPQETLQRAAQMMGDLNVGALPVCDGDRLIGMITDRDITIRSASAGAAPVDARVQEAMSPDVRFCFEDQPLDEVIQQMADSLIRRVPVISHDEAHRLVGIVALGDLATRTDESKKPEVEQAVEKVSSPSEPDRSRQPEGARAAGGGASPAAGKSAAGDAGGIGVVGAPGAAIAPGAPAGDKDAVGSGPSPETTGAGRQGRVGFAGDPGGWSPVEESGQQSAATSGAAGGAESAGTTGKAESKDATPASGTSGGNEDAASTGGKAGGTAGKGSGGAKP
jgi:CBS domain-containing protein